MNKYAHAFDIIENWDRVELKGTDDVWRKPMSGPENQTLACLDNKQLFRLKREPRRVWVNFCDDGRIGNVGESPDAAKRIANPSWCSESAVEFVEVIKQ